MKIYRYPEPFFFTVVKGMPLLVLSCSKDKRRVRSKRELVRFGDLYDGPMWQQLRASGFPMSNVAALSALYGVLEPGHAIHTYDCEMDEDSSRRFCTTSNDVWRLAELIEQAGSAFVVGGRLYQAIARAAEKQRPFPLGSIRYATGSFLQQRKQLGDWLTSNKTGAAA